MIRSARQSLGIQIAEQPCPRCGGRMMRIPCKCPFRRQGYAVCAKCLNPACAHQVGLVKRQRAVRHSGLGGAFNAFSQ